MSELADKIRHIVHEWDETLKDGSHGFIAACVCLFCGLVSFDDWDSLDNAVSSEFGSHAPQMVANLRLGGAITLHGFCSGIDIHDGTTLCLMINIAEGKMRYLQKSGKYQMTEVGKNYIESKLLTPEPPASTPTEGQG